MAYSISNQDASYCVVTDTGDYLSCWPTHEEAQAALDRLGHPSAPLAAPLASVASNQRYAELFDVTNDRHSGVMLALYPDPALAQQITQLPGVTATAEQLHLTLCYCGDAALLTDSSIAAAIFCAEQVAGHQEPLTGTLNGLGRFNATESSDGQDVIVALVDLPGLAALRDDLLDLLDGFGCTYSATHGFTPHMTLAYVGAGAQSPVLTWDTLPVTFGSISVNVGDKRVDFTLQGQKEMNEKAGSAVGGVYCLFNEYKFVEPPEWLPLLPKPGVFKHPKYGDVNISAERNRRFVDNMNQQVYQNRIPVDAEHDLKGSGALGWITQARLNSDGTADGRVEWNERGKRLIRDDRFAFVSPEWWDEWTAPDTEVVHKDVLIGAGLVKRPFFKHGSLRPLIASDAGLYAPNDNFDVLTKETEMADSTQFAELQAEMKEQQKQFAELSKNLADAETARVAAEAQNKKFQEDLTKAQGHLAALETEKKLKRFHDMAEGWAGDTASHLAVMDLLAVTYGEDSTQFKTYAQNQRAVAEQLAQGQLFNELGRNRQGTGAVVDTLEALVIKAMSEHSLGRLDAQSYVFNANPNLYTQYARSVEQKI